MRHDLRSGDLSFGTAVSTWHPKPFSGWLFFSPFPSGQLYIPQAHDRWGQRVPSFRRSRKGQRSCLTPSHPLSWFIAVSGWARPQRTAEPTQVPCSLLPSLGSWMRAEFDFLILSSLKQKEKCSPGTWPGFCTQAERGPAKAGHRKPVTPRSPEAALGTKKGGCSHPFTYKLSKRH